MLTRLRKVGNSRGVILPAPFLNALNLDQEIEMRLENGQIILEAPSSPRRGWFDGYSREGDDLLWDEGLELGPSEDWEW